MLGDKLLSTVITLESLEVKCPRFDFGSMPVTVIVRPCGSNNSIYFVEVMLGLNERMYVRDATTQHMSILSTLAPFVN